MSHYEDLDLMLAMTRQTGRILDARIHNLQNKVRYLERVMTNLRREVHVLDAEQRELMGQARSLAG